MIKWNEYTWYSKWATLIFFILIFPFFTFYIGTQYELAKTNLEITNIESDNIALSTWNPDHQSVAVSPTLSSNGVTCAESSEYFIAYRDSTTDNGEDYLVKHKKTGTINPPCEFDSKNFDYATSNWFFEGVQNNYLILDAGTGPGIRDLIIFNLDTQKEVFRDGYQGLSISPADNTLSYLNYINETPNIQNCPEFNEYTSKGLAPVLNTHVILNLNDLSKKDLGNHVCTAQQ